MATLKGNGAEKGTYEIPLIDLSPRSTNSLVSPRRRVLGSWPPPSSELPKKEGAVPLTDSTVRPVIETPTKLEDRVVGGLNQALAVRKEQRYDKKLEKEMREWLAEKLPNFKEPLLSEEKSFHQVLKSGVILCHLLNTLKSNSVKNISNLKIAFKQMENISSYLQTCSTLFSVPSTALFSTVDLFEGKDMFNVLMHLQYMKQWSEQKPSETVNAKREKISLIIKSTPREIEDAEGATVDNSWRKDLKDGEGRSTPVMTPRTKPRQDSASSLESQPEWKRKMIEKEQQINLEKSREDALRRQKVERTVRRGSDCPVPRLPVSELPEESTPLSPRPTLLSPRTPRTSQVSMSNREILRLRARHSALERICQKRGRPVPLAPVLPPLVLPRPKPDASARTHRDSTDKNPTSPWGVSLRASVTITKNAEREKEIPPEESDMSAKDLWKKKVSSPQMTEDNGAASARPSRLRQIIADRRKQKEVKEVEEAKEKVVVDEAFEKEKKEKIAAGDPYFGIGRERGLEIWRIEKLQAVPWPKEDYGIFCTGDSYIVLFTHKPSGPWDIFFWLGSESSQDEMGAAAYKTVELDDRLGGAATQHREVQFHESEQFMSVFKGGIEYTSEGAVDSAFRKVDRDAFETRLLHLKGSRNVRVKPVLVSYLSLNSGDVFVLETAKTIWQWNGSESSRREKLTGLQTTTRMRDSRKAKVNVEVIEEGSEPDLFWEAIGGKGPVKTADEGGSDDQYEKTSSAATKLYHVSDATGTLEVNFISTSPLKQEMLNSDDCHILDIGTELFVWVGKGCTKQEKEQSMLHAMQFLKDDADRPDWVPITRVVQGAETPILKAQFTNWKDTGINKESENTWGNSLKHYDAYLERQRKIREENANRKIDVAGLIKTRTEKKELFSTEGEGKIQIWRIENFEAVPVPADQYGIFYGGDSYIIYYSPESRKQTPLLYYWLGKKSTKDEQGAAVLLTKEISRKCQGDRQQATHVRVTQGKEPGHFLNLFKGKFVVRFGGVASGFKNVEEEEIDDHGIQLFHIHGTAVVDTKAVQVASKSSSLNSADTFVLNTETKQFVWYGKGCEEIEREFANTAAQFLNKGQEVLLVEEEQEPDEFWEKLGGKGEYQNSPELQAEVRDARLFHCSNASGKFEIEEIHNYDQDDLLMDDVFLLDVYSCVMVWVGPESNEEEKLKSFEMALEYVGQASLIDGRDPECSVIRILAGAEPPMFTRWFHGWDDTRGESDAYRIALEALKNEVNTVMDVKVALDQYKKAETLKFPYRDLIRTHEKPLPNEGRGIDKANLEKYLTDEEFEKIFKMKRDAWEKVPRWKRNTLKQKVLLF